MCEDSGGAREGAKKKGNFHTEARRHGGKYGEEKANRLSVRVFFASLREHFGDVHAKARRREGVRGFSHGGTGGMTKGDYKGGKMGSNRGENCAGGAGRL